MQINIFISYARFSIGELQKGPNDDNELQNDIIYACQGNK